MEEITTVYNRTDLKVDLKYGKVELTMGTEGSLLSPCEVEWLIESLQEAVKEMTV